MTRPKVGLFAGGIEQYWKETGMKDLPAALNKDARRLVGILGKKFDVVYPGFAANAADAEKMGKILREEEVDIALMYHGTYLDDEMSLVFLDQLCGVFPVLFLSQGLGTFSPDDSLTDSGRTWGNNSAVQITGTLKRMKPDLRYGLVFGGFDSPRAMKEIEEYARAAAAVKKLRKSRIAMFPHRSSAVPMYDTFPDETMMIAQTGATIFYLYIQNLLDAMKEVSDEDTTTLTDELYDKYEVIEPPREEVSLAARQAIALERVVRENNVDALAIDTRPGMIPYTGMIPCVGMARLIDQGTVVATEGDLGVSVSGLILQELAGKPIHFWEHLTFDEERNAILGGHEGGWAGFSMAKAGTRPRLRNTQYINFEGVPGAPHNGVLPEFITNPGPVTLLTLFRGVEGYEMRLGSGESVDMDPLPVHYEHTVFRPNIPLPEYYRRMADIGICHHFGLVHAEVAGAVEKVAHMLDMELAYFTDAGESGKAA